MSWPKHYIIVLLLLAVPRGVVAQQFFRIPIDTPSDVSISGVNDQDRLIFTHGHERSYCCSIQSDESDVGAQFFGLNSNSGFNLPGGFAPRGTTEPVIVVSGSHSAPENSRACFLILTQFSQNRGMRLTMTFDGTPTMPLAVQCRETSLFGHFNTVVNELNFLELTNTSVGTVKVAVFGKVSTDGGASNFAVGDVFVAGGTRVDLDIHSRAGAAAFGNLIVIHDGAPGQLKAVLSQYKITSTNPLSFELVTSNDLVTRAQLSGGN